MDKEKRQAFLKPYDVHVERGFLPPEDPLVQMPLVLAGWCEIAEQLPKLMVAGQVKHFVDTLPVINIDVLKTNAELERAMLAFSFIGHAYVWGDKTPPQALPASLAVPWHAVAKKLGRPPVLSYASYMLHNWRRIQKSGPISLENTCLIQNFLAGVDEEWFILVHLAIEAQAGAALASIFPAQEAVANNDEKELEEELLMIGKALSGMYTSLLRMPEKCDPYIYYNRVRPYIHGWRDHPLFVEGLLYTDVSEYSGKPQRFRGETGAQSSIIPSLDAVLGVVHENDYMRHYLNEMRDYMPPKHRAFIEAIEKGPSVRQFVTEKKGKNIALGAAYNQCVEWVELFRTKHLEYANNYIFKQQEMSHTNPHAVGTGGTPFMPYLQKHRDETAAHKLSAD